MTIKLSTKAGGGEFKPSFFSGSLTLAAGASGTVISLTPPPGKKVRLSLLTASNTGNENGMTVNVDGVSVISSLILTDSRGTSVAGYFYIGGLGAMGGSGTLSNGFGILNLTSEADGSIQIIKDSGSTVQTLVYAYQYGD